MRFRPWLAILLTFLAWIIPAQARELPKGVAWLWELNDSVTLPPVVQGQVTLVVTNDQALGLRTSDGARLWEVKLEQGCSSEVVPILVGGLAILPASGGVVQALDLASGAKRWSAPASQSSPQLCAGRLVVLEAGSLSALDPMTGEVRWRMAGDQFSGMAVHGSRIFYATSKEIGVYDLASGKSLWRESGKDSEGLLLGPTVALSAATDLVARDPATGRRLWKLPQCDTFELLGDRVLARSQYRMHAVLARTGQRLWSNDEYADHLVEVGSNLVAASNGYNMTLLDRHTGKVLKQPDGFFPPLLDGAQALVAGSDGNLYRFDARSGRTLPGLRQVWGRNTSTALGPRGWNGKGLKLLPAGSALVALGEGPGTVHMAGPPNLDLEIDSPQTPGKITLGSEARFVRKLTVSAYRYPGATALEQADLGPAVVSTSWSGPAGSQARRDERTVTLKEPGNYVLEVASGTTSERRAIVVTPMGVTVKVAPGQLLIQALDLVRQVPLPGVTLEMGPPDQPATMVGTTGADGTFSLTTQEALDQPLRVRLRHGAEDFPMEIKPSRFSSSDKVFLQTDRPLYRPGHEVFFKGLAANGGGSERTPLTGTRVKIEIHDSGDNPLFSQEMVSDQWGTFSGSLRLPAEPPLGRYRISASIGEGELFHLPFEVQEYRKPPFEVSLTSRSRLVRAGQPLLFDLAASYYFGGPVPGARAVVTVRRAELSGPPSPGYPGYQSYADFVSEQEVTLGPDGKAVVTVPTNPEMPDSEYLVDVEITGPSGQVVEGSASALAAASAYGVYLSQSSWMANPGQPVSVTVRTLDRLGKPQPGTVELRVERWDDGWQPAARGVVKTGASGQAIYSWTPAKTTGSYRVLAFSPDPGLKGRELDEISYWVSGDGAGIASERKLTAEKTEYRAGETARLLFQARKAGPALLTVEGDKLFLSRSFSAKAGAQVLSLPVQAAYAPGVTVSIASLENGEMVYDPVTLTVPDTVHKLTMDVRADKAEYRPGESAILHLTVSDALGQPVDAEASLAVVDESLFALRPDQVPSIHQLFFGPRDNRVQTFTLEPRRNQVAGFQTVPAPTRVRKDFKDTAFWQPSVLISGGKAEVSVPLPDNLTRWRATTRASTARLEVGQAAGTLVTNLPLMAQAILPRFLVEGDAVDLLGLVTNRTKAPVNVEVALAATPGELEREEVTLNSLAADGQGRAVSRLRVEENVLGKAPLPSRLEVQVEARSSGGESDAEQISIPILPFGQPFAKGGSGLLKPGESKEQRLESPRALLKPKLEIRVAGSPLAAVVGALDYLADFPYGCVEQTMSRFLPTVVAAQAMGELGLFSEERKAKLAPMVEKGLSALYGYQHSDGGWGWWNDDATHPYMTGYVISGLAMARKAGYTISEQVLRRGIDSAESQLRQLVPEPPSPGEDTDTRVYLAWALAVAGKPPLADLEALSTRPNLSTYSVALLALAWQDSGQPSRALPLVEELERRAKPAGLGVSWPAQALGAYGWTDDDLEATALALRAVLASKPDSENARGAVTYLLSQRNGAQWKSTRDTAQAVLALLDFAGHDKGAPRTGSLDVRWDGQTLKTVPLSDKEQVVSVPPESLGAGPHTLELKGSGSQAIYSYAQTGFLKEKEQVDLPADYAGLRLMRTYVVEQPGKLLRWNRVVPPEILNVPTGQELQVEIEFELPDSMQYLKLEDPRPAGFEVIEGSLDGQARPDREEYRDAFSAFFFTRLGKGKHSFTYRMRAETPGEYRSLPARVELMYQPAVYGTSPSQRVKVRRAEEAE